MKPEELNFRKERESIVGMEYVLVDIKNFLKKLENGQLEIEAGQWELQKTLLNMSKVVADLKNLSQDVEDMRLSNIQQMELIKEMQIQLEKLQKAEPMTVSESSVEYERVFKRPAEGRASSKGFKKRKCRIRSEEIIEITSNVSNEKTESEYESTATADLCPTEPERKDFSATTTEQNSDDVSSNDLYKTDSYTTPKQTQGSCQYSATNNDMLQRYLKDSIKYIDRPVSNTTEPTQHSSQGSECDKSKSVEHSPFWDDYSSRTPPDSHSENRNTKTMKENSTGTENVTSENILPKKFLCPKCPRRFMSKAESLRHGKKHRASENVFHCKNCGKGFGCIERLKDHEQVHRISRNFKGFRCSYCSKLCSSPEKLTAHLRKCRIIMKSHYKKK